MNSALLQGQVEHRRFGEKPHAFRYRVHLALLDLDELGEVFRGRWFWSVEKPNWVSFRRRDYLGAPATPLADAVRARIAEKLGRRPLGKVQILTQLRTFGYLFNPVSFYFCYDEHGGLDAIVAEITNTPWGERHAYVLDTAGQDDLVFRFDKDFHVSPFFDMDQVYEWRFRVGPDGMGVSMTNFEHAKVVFHVDLSLERRAIDRRSLATALVRYPLQPLRLHLAIYWHAARLFLKRVTFFTHPDKRVPTSGAHKA